MIISILSSLKVQQNELQILKQLFNKIDTNHDGTLTFEELSNGLLSLQSLEMFKSNDYEDNTEQHIKQMV